MPKPIPLMMTSTKKLKCKTF